MGKPEFKKSSVLYTDEQLIDKPMDVSAYQLCVTDYNNDGKKDILVGSRSMTYKWKDNVTDNVKAMVRKNIVLMKSYFNKAKDAYSRVCFTMRGQPYEKIKEALSKDKEYVESTKKSGEYSSLVTPYIERVMKTESYIYVIPGKY